MKKALFVLLAFLVLFSFVSCAEEHEHSWDEGSVFIEATCSNYGAKLYTCTCGAQNIELVQKLTHGTPKADTAKYGSDNKLYYICTNCGEELDKVDTSDKKTLKNVIIPDSVTRIYDYILSSCKALETVTIPTSVESICKYAFASCEALKTVEIPNTVTTLGEYVFFSCSGLTSATISAQITTIPKSLFYSCIALETIKIPATVTSIGENAFYNCNSLKTINFSGTAAKWKALADTAGTDWKKNVPATCQVICSNGTVDIDGNAIPE